MDAQSHREDLSGVGQLQSFEVVEQMRFIALSHSDKAEHIDPYFF